MEGHRRQVKRFLSMFRMQGILSVLITWTSSVYKLGCVMALAGQTLALFVLKTCRCVARGCVA